MGWIIEPKEPELICRHDLPKLPKRGDFSSVWECGLCPQQFIAASHTSYALRSGLTEIKYWKKLIPSEGVSDGLR